jgi:hypothetical protein
MVECLGFKSVTIKPCLRFKSRSRIYIGDNWDSFTVGSGR